jgi:hypothetical protein
MHKGVIRWPPYNLDRVTFVGHYLQTFVEVAIDPFDKHTIVVPTGEGVTIDLKEVDGFFEYAKEFTVFIQHNCVAETKTQLDFHNTQSK